MDIGFEHTRQEESSGSRPTGGTMMANLDAVASELKRLVARPLAPRHVASYKVLPTLPSVQSVLPSESGPTRTARAVVEVIAEAIGHLDGQTVCLRGMEPIHLDATAMQHAMSELLGITEFGETDYSTAPTRRAAAAKALGLDLATLGGDKAFREIHEPVLLRSLAAQLITHNQMPSWLVENVGYHYRYNADRVYRQFNEG